MMQALANAADQLLWMKAHLLCAGFIVFVAIAAVAGALLWQPMAAAEPAPRGPPPAGRISWMLLPLAVLLGIYAAVIPARESMTWWDANQLFSSFTGHQFYPSPVWPGAGRLFPLAHQEFEFLGRLSPTLFFYHMFAAAELLALVGIIGWMLRSRPEIAALICFAVITTPAVAQASFELIYPERNMMPLLCIALIGAERWRDGGCYAWLVAAAAAGGALLLYKETAFLLLICVCATAVAGWRSGALQGGQRRLLALVLAWGLGIAVWLITYAVAIFPEITRAYGSASLVTRQAAVEALAAQPWAWLLLCLLAVRGVELLRAPSRFDTVWDGAMLAAPLYAVAVVALRFTAPYYMAPAALLTWLLLGRFLAARPSWSWLLLIGGGVALLQLPVTIDQIRGQKEMVGAKGQAVRYFADAASVLPEPLRIHFMDSTRYEAGLFAGLLQAQYGVTAQAGIGFTGSTAFSSCTTDIQVQCADNMPERPGDFIVSFGQRLDAAGLAGVFVSNPVGFWPNHYQVYIYRVMP
jgi:hypothetical protein